MLVSSTSHPSVNEFAPDTRYIDCGMVLLDLAVRALLLTSLFIHPAVFFYTWLFLFAKNMQ